MTYRDYFEQHCDQNIGWCKPFTDKNEEYFLIQYDGEIISAKTPAGIYHRYDGTLTADTMESIARAVNNGYYCYRGWTDEHVALDVMHEIGCAQCPFHDTCEAYNEEVN